MTELQKRIADKSNIYLAYLRTKNNLLNNELVLNQNIYYFESELESNLANIHKFLSCNEYKPWPFEKFDFILKYKQIEKNGIKYRPLVRLSFMDQVYTQCIFNVIMDELRNFLPKENLGVQLMPKNSKSVYKYWSTQYKEFVTRQRNNCSENSVYRTCFEYDIEQFFPSIDQDAIILDLVNLLRIEVNDIVYCWLKEIIKFYSKQNISDKTKNLYNLYLKSLGENIPKNTREDLGLPQGAIYSPFLASLYTRDIYPNIKSHFEKKGIVCDFFSYVDDGRLYISADEDATRIKELITSSLVEISKKSNKNKVLKINEEKTNDFLIVDHSSLSKLDSLVTEISMANLSVNPNFDVDLDIVNTAIEKYEKLKEELDRIDNSISVSQSGERKKLEKEITTLLKRRTSFFTRKISSNEKFYDVVGRIYNVVKSDAQNLARVNFDITTFNYYFNLKNLLESANKDEYKLSYLCHNLKNYIQSYISSHGKESFIFYIISTVKAIYEADFSLSLKELLEWIFSEYDEFNEFLLKFFMSFTSLKWHQAFHEKFVDKLNPISTFEEKALIYYFNYPYMLEESVDYLHEIKNRTKFSENIDKLESINVEIIPYDLEKSGEVGLKFIKNNEDYLLNLVTYWFDFFKKYNYIRPGFLISNNVFVFEEKKKIIIYDDTSDFYDAFVLKNHYLNYKEYFKKFFFDFFDCNESFLVNRKGVSLRFWEYRILSYLSNKSFDLEDFFEILKDSINGKELLNHDVDGNFERIRMIVDENLKTSKEKDIILLLHYYVHCSWKNGSKDLYFYTLHNEEHSLMLIRNYLEISKRIFNKISLTKNERFILFCACYLHDIGMLSSLNDEEKYKIQDTRILKFYDRFKKYISEENTSNKIEEILLKIYTLHEATEQLNEIIVRGDHGKRSSLDIQQGDELPLNDLEKRYVAIVSQNHMLDNSKVYGMEHRVEYRNTSIDIRKISIWLRLLDLTDVTKHRVTQEVFNKCFDHMGNDSKFHWIRHLSVDDVLFTSEFNKEEDTLTLKIKILYNYLPPEEKIDKKCSKECKYCYKEEDNGYVPKKYEEGTTGFCDLRKYYLRFANWFDAEVESINQYCSIHNNKFKIYLAYKLNEKTQRENFRIVTNARKRKGYITATEFVRKYLIEKC